MAQLARIAPCLWYIDQAEEAANLYTSIFPGAKLLSVTRYTKVGREHHGREPGSVMTVAFELLGIHFTALNGGPLFKFNESISLQVLCDTQDEVDHYWSKLSAGGDPKAQVCGWLKDKFGVSWQVTPYALVEMLNGSDPARVERATTAMFKMAKFDIAALRRAYEG